jgi:hypothetical protein
MDVVEVEVKDKDVPAPKIDKKTGKKIEPEPCVDTKPTNAKTDKDDKDKKTKLVPTSKVCPGKGGNHDDHAEFCSLADDSKIMNSDSGVKVVKGSG